MIIQNGNQKNQFEEITAFSENEECKLIAFHFVEEVRSVGFDLYNSEGKLTASFGLDMPDLLKVAEFIKNQATENVK